MKVGTEIDYKVDSNVYTDSKLVTTSYLKLDEDISKFK